MDASASVADHGVGGQTSQGGFQIMSDRFLIGRGPTGNVGPRPFYRFAAVTEHIVLRVAEAQVQEILAWYDFGCALHYARYAEVEGLKLSSVITPLAGALDLHPSALRRYARVSEAIRPGELAFLIRLRGLDGLPLRWSHLELLSDVRSAERRRELAIEACSEGLSVRKLAGRIRDSAKDKPSR